MDTAFQLYEILIKRFNESELQILCFALGVEYGDLHGSDKLNKAKELIGFLERRERLSELLFKGKHLRSDINWDNISVNQQHFPSSVSAILPEQTPKLHESERIVFAVQRMITSCANWVKKVQNPDGGLPSDNEGSYSCTWSTSGLLWAAWTANTSFNEFWTIRALSWVFNNRNPDFGIPVVIKGDPSITDATAQTAIICCLALLERDESFFREMLEGCVRWLLYNRLPQEGWNWRPSAESSWIASTAFALLALSHSKSMLTNYPDELNETINEVKKWLKESQNLDGGWGSQKGAESRPALTGLVTSILKEVDQEFDCTDSMNYILDKQNEDGTWPISIDRPTGHTVTRLGTAYCMRALADCGYPLYAPIFQKGLTALSKSYDHPRFRFQDTVMLTWPTRDSLLALTSIGVRLGLANVRRFIT